jgi:hypothetical protein
MFAMRVDEMSPIRCRDATRCDYNLETMVHNQYELEGRVAELEAR